MQCRAQVTLEEVGGDIQVTVNVVEPFGDLRGLFFNIADDALLSGLTVNGADITSSLFGPNGSVSNLGGGNNVTPLSFDAGVEIGTPGIGQDDIATTTFTISHESV